MILEWKKKWVKLCLGFIRRWRLFCGWQWCWCLAMVILLVSCDQRSFFSSLKSIRDLNGFERSGFFLKIVLIRRKTKWIRMTFIYISISIENNSVVNQTCELSKLFQIHDQIEAISVFMTFLRLFEMINSDCNRYIDLFIRHSMFRLWVQFIANIPKIWEKWNISKL